METKYLIQRLAEKNESFYLYDEQSILSQINLLKNNFPSVDFLFSMQCNSNREVLKSIFHKNIGAHAASLGEVDLAFSLGLSKNKIFYSAPGKSMSDLQNAYFKSTIIADSISEIQRLHYMAKVLNCYLEIGVRINPSFSLEKDESLPSKFGIDEKEFFENLHNLNGSRVKIVGIQGDSKSQELDCSKLNRFHKKTFQLAQKVETELGYSLKFINLGSGIGIPYNSNDKDFNIPWLGHEMEERIENFRITHPKTKIIIESGRFIVGNCGTYVTHVIDKKISCEKTFVILQNIFSGFLKPCISNMVTSYSNNPMQKEPLFTKADSYQIKILNPREEKEIVTLIGNTCCDSDVLAENIEISKLRIGDIITINNAGSYASVLTPNQYALQTKSKEFFFTVDGEVI